MKILLLFFLCAFSIGAIAQKSDTLVVYAINGTATNKISKANSVYKIYKKDSTSWVRLKFGINLEPISKETFSDSALTTLHGNYTQYRNGKISLKGSFYDNEKTGSWIDYDSTGKATATKIYIRGKLNGASARYWTNGKMQEEGSYSDGRKKGEWKVYYPSGKLAVKEIYNESNKLIDSTYLDSSGIATHKDSIITAPNFPGGLNLFYKSLSKAVRYPDYDVHNRIQGKVYLSFIISESGYVEDITIISAPSRTLADEVIRVLQNMPRWTPGKLLKQPIPLIYKINVGFSLN
ncbi:MULTISPECIES: energy transducer TonB [Pedobacter]|uniref:energy transducer TonB n=1 Tax=Pedobacter TaxID=84567 RepID=UPI001E41FB4F|nr:MULTISPECIES: energy transducer TonB [Pedobacter]